MEAAAEKEAQRSARTFEEIRQERRELEAILGEGQQQEERETKTGVLIIGPWAAAIGAALADAWRRIGERGGRKAQGLVAGGAALAITFGALAAVGMGDDPSHPLAGPPVSSAPTHLPPIGADPPRVGPPRSGPPAPASQQVPSSGRPRPRLSDGRPTRSPESPPTRSKPPSEPTTPPTGSHPTPPSDGGSSDGGGCSLLDVDLRLIHLRIGCLSL